MGLTQERASIGLPTPTWAAKQRIWADVAIPLAGIQHGYQPSPSARQAHQSDAVMVGVSGGWRAGKSLSAAMEALAWLPFSQLVWLVSVDYERTRQEFSYLAQAALSLGLTSRRMVAMPLNKYQPCALRTINGCLVETISLAADPSKVLTAKPPDLVVVCEPGLIDGLYTDDGNDIIQLIEGRLMEKRGRAWLSGTSDNSSESWFRLWTRWREEASPQVAAFHLPTWENVHRFPQGEDEPRLVDYRKRYGEEVYLAHFGGIPSSPAGLVLKGYWSDNLIDPSAVFDPHRPVEVAIDPNYSLGNRYVVEALQPDASGMDIPLVDEVAVEGMTHDEVIAICKSRPWWPNVMGGVIDPFAGDTHVYGSPAPLQYWRPLTLRMNHRPRVGSTVQALKEAMVAGPGGHARLRVNPACERFIWEARNWKQEGTLGLPSKKNCDALKAVGYWLVDRFYVERVSAEDNIVTWVDTTPVPRYAHDWRID